MGRGMRCQSELTVRHTRRSALCRQQTIEVYRFLPDAAEVVVQRNQRDYEYLISFIVGE